MVAGAIPQVFLVLALTRLLHLVSAQDPNVYILATGVSTRNVVSGEAQFHRTGFTWLTPSVLRPFSTTVAKRYGRLMRA
jgi:hypothetical protein